MSDEQKLEQLLSEQKYMVLAVTLDDGTPWAVPVRIRTGDGSTFEWDSHLQTLHSKAIARQSTIAITIFQILDDSQTGYYASGVAELVDEFKPGFGRYKFTVEKAWINDETFKKRALTIK